MVTAYSANRSSERAGSGEAEGWNFADVWEWIAEAIPNQPALSHAGSEVSWAEFDRTADAIASTLLEGGLRRQDKVGVLLFNASSYLQIIFGVVKAAMVPVCTNRRYVASELAALWDDADVTSVFFHSSLLNRVAEVKDRLPRVRTWIWVSDGFGSCPSWAADFDDVISRSTVRVRPPWGRSGKDVFLAYTEGTTGPPKGVVWKQCDLYNNFSDMIWHDPVAPSRGDVLARVLSKPSRPIALPSSPFFHGTGQFVALQELCLGGCVVTLSGRSFSAVELFDTVDARKVSVVAIVGDAFGMPMLKALDQYPNRWSLRTLRIVISAGAILSERTKRELIREMPWIKIVDSLCSYDAMFVGFSVASHGESGETGLFHPGKATRVVGPDGQQVEPGSTEIGRIAVGGFQASGYYKDPVMSLKSTQRVGIERYRLSGDYAFVDADGTLIFAGRGSRCINSAGEQIVPAEVEQVINSHPAVRQSAVVGVPDDYFGEKVVALVELNEHMAVIPQHLVDYVRVHLASFKLPRNVYTVDKIHKFPDDSIDYPLMRQHAMDRDNAQLIHGVSARRAADPRRT